MGKQPLDSPYSLRTRCLLALLACASFALAGAAYSAAQNFEFGLESSVIKGLPLAQATSSASNAQPSNAQLGPTDFSLNPFVDSDVAHKRVLLSRFLDLDEQYWSMHFDKEREMLRVQLVPVLQKLVNLAPLDSRYAQHLFFAYSSKEDNDDDFAWLVNRTYGLLKWSPNQYQYMARHCMDQYEQLKTLSANACANVISDVAANNNTKQLLRIFKKDHDQLAQMYSKIGLNLEFKHK